MNRWIAYGLLAAAAIAGYLWWEHRTEQAGALAERQRLEAVADLQREANRDRSRIADQGYAARTVYRDRFITQTITEVRHATADIAACRLNADAVRLLNAAADCATEDRPATCGAGDGVQPP